MVKVTETLEIIPADTLVPRSVKIRYDRRRVVTDVPDRKTRALQSEKRNSDINHIVAKAIETRQLPVMMNREPLPEMIPAATYQDMLNTVVFAQQSFERLPAEVRQSFANKPENMLAAIEQAKDNPKLRSDLVNLGLMNPLSEQAPSAPTTQVTAPVQTAQAPSASITQATGPMQKTAEGS